jgi:hypothetical protein
MPDFKHEFDSATCLGGKDSHLSGEVTLSAANGRCEYENCAYCQILLGLGP